jgi:N-acetylmuramoyl-L-alanine amidase
MDDLIERLAAAYRGYALPHQSLRAVTLAQWLLESGRGTSALAREHLNFAGLKWRLEMAPFASRIDYAAHDGADAYCRFATLEAFIAGYWAFLARKPYAGWVRLADDPAGFIRFIGPIYTPAPGYADRVLALLPEAERMLGRGAGGAAPAADLGTVVLDPGHGGTTRLPGSSPNNATSVSGVLEKTLTLDFGFTLRDALIAQAARAGETIKVVLTRDRDINVAGAERAGLAAKLGARAFLSLHFNGAGDAGVRGTETFYRAAENGNVNPAPDIAFARAVQSGLLAGLRAIDAGAKDRGVKPDTQSGPGGLGVLNPRSLGNVGRARPCMAALAEVEFITHPAVDRLIVEGAEAVARRRALAEPLAEAIRGWLRG